MNIRSALLGVVLALLGCAATQDKFAEKPAAWNPRADMELRVHDNVRLAWVVGLDSILCKAVVGGEGKIYFDEVLWRTMDLAQKTTLVQCLDLKRGLQVTAFDSARGREQLWTVRFSDDQRRMLVGTVWSDCIDCNLRNVKMEYILSGKGGVLTAHPTSEFEMWR